MYAKNKQTIQNRTNTKQTNKLIKEIFFKFKIKAG